MAKKMTAEEERKAIEDDEKKLAIRRARLVELEQSERLDLFTKSALQKAPLDELKAFFDTVRKLGFAEASKRLNRAN